MFRFFRILTEQAQLPFIRRQSQRRSFQLELACEGGFP
jgi:hypothetical protein